MITILKYTLKATDTQVIQLPRCAQLLCVQVQHHSQIQLWAKVDTEEELRPCTVTMVGTGKPAQDCPRRHLGTVQLQEGMLVLHVFVDQDA